MEETAPPGITAQRTQVLCLKNEQAEYQSNIAVREPTAVQALMQLALDHGPKALGQCHLLTAAASSAKDENCVYRNWTRGGIHDFYDYLVYKVLQ